MNGKRDPGSEKVPSLGAVIIILASSCMLLAYFGSGLLFTLQANEGVGRVVELNGTYGVIQYTDESASGTTEVTSQIEYRYTHSVAVGDDIPIEYWKDEVRVPALQGRYPYFVDVLFVLMAVIAPVSYTRKYLHGRSTRSRAKG